MREPKRYTMTPRQGAILGAIVEEHVRTAAPVGSKVVRERYGIDVSTATIRSEMSVLERWGYIRQPHTSAGRVPADSGYRAYVDELMPMRPPRIEELAWVHSEFRRAGKALEDIFRTTCRVLSQLTSAPSMVMAPPEERVFLVSLRLSPISSTLVRLVHETEPGGRRECVLESAEKLTAAQVELLGRALAERYVGRELGALSLCAPHQIEDELAPYPVPESLLDQIKTAVERDRMQRVYVDGAVHALSCPEHQTVERLRPVMEALDEESTLRRLLRPAARRGRLTITIGHEQQVETLQACSVVAHHYCGANDEVGALGVIGPTRMPYREHAAAVACVADHISEALAQRKTEEKR